MTKIINDPIRLNNTTIMMVYFYTRTNEFVEMWLHDDINYMEEDMESNIKAAGKFMGQFKDLVSMRFMMALRDEIDEHLTQWNDKLEKMK